MEEILFLDEEIVLEVHQDQITRYGGSPRIRELGLLSSAIAIPRASFDGAFLHAGIVEMAAAYMYHLILNHPFVDGNKRTGTVSALVFLNLNGADLDVPIDLLEHMAFGVASGEMTKGELTTIFQRHTVPFDL